MSNLFIITSNHLVFSPSQHFSEANDLSCDEAAHLAGKRAWSNVTAFWYFNNSYIEEIVLTYGTNLFHFKICMPDYVSVYV